MAHAPTLMILCKMTVIICVREGDFEEGDFEIHGQNFWIFKKNVR